MKSDDKETKRRGRGGPGRGQGRPKGSKNKRTIEIEEAVQKYSGDAIKALVKVAKYGRQEAARVAAANSLLDRGFGRPRQALEHSGPDGKPIQSQDVTTDDVRKKFSDKIDGLGKRLVPEDEKVVGTISNGTNGKH